MTYRSVKKPSSALLRLRSGRRIRSADDDPAGLSAVFTDPPLAAFGVPNPSAWFSVWSVWGGGRPDFFYNWIWTDYTTAHFLARRAKGVALSSDHEMYRVRRGTSTGYGWHQIQGTAWGVWWDAKHVGWVWANGVGVMNLNAMLQGDSGDTLRFRDTSGRIIT